MARAPDAILDALGTERAERARAVGGARGRRRIGSTLGPVLLALLGAKLAIMIPFFASALGTFFLRQTFKQVPQELDDASVLDGANWWQTLWHVYLPGARAALVAFSVVSISFHWSDFLWPLIVTN